jgi:hypothetical protein
MLRADWSSPDSLRQKAVMPFGITADYFTKYPTHYSVTEGPLSIHFSPEGIALLAFSGRSFAVSNASRNASFERSKSPRSTAVI